MRWSAWSTTGSKDSGYCFSTGQSAKPLKLLSSKSESVPSLSPRDRRTERWSVKHLSSRFVYLRSVIYDRPLSAQPSAASGDTVIPFTRGLCQSIRTAIMAPFKQTRTSRSGLLFRPYSSTSSRKRFNRGIRADETSLDQYPKRDSLKEYRCCWFAKFHSDHQWSKRDVKLR